MSDIDISSIWKVQHRQLHWDKKQISGGQGLRWDEGWNGEWLLMGIGFHLESLLKLSVVIVPQPYEYIKTIDLYTFSEWIAYMRIIFQ